MRSSEVFASDHLGDAILRLYECHASSAPEGAQRSRADRTAQTVRAWLTPFDFDRFAPVLDPDVETVDHRTLGTWNSQGAHAALEQIQGLRDVSFGAAVHDEDVLALEPAALLVRRMHSGTERAGGGVYERPFLVLVTFGLDGRLNRWEFFDVGDETQALARFDQLTAAADDRLPTRGPRQRRVRANRATATWDRIVAAVHARDSASLEATMSDSLVYVHHSTGTTFGKPETMATWLGAFQAEQLAYQMELLATLGESLVLGRQRTSISGLAGESFEDFGPAQMDGLIVAEDAGTGFQRAEEFGLDRLGPAIVRLFERYAEILPEGPERGHRTTAARVMALVLSAEPGNLDDLRADIDPGFESVDRRPLRTWSGRGGEALLEHMRALQEVANGLAMPVTEVLALEPNTVLVRRMHSGTERVGGGVYERPHLGLFVTGTDGRLQRYEIFDDDRVDDALACFEDLTGSPEAESSEEPFVNAASRTDRKLFRCFNARDWEGVLDCTASELVFDERRRMVRNTCGRDVWLEQFRILFDVPKSRFTTKLLATRGERLALNLHSFAGEVADGGGPLAMDDQVVIREVDGDGRVVTVVVFDVDDFDAAYAELDARFEATDDLASSPSWNSLRGFVRAVAQHDWDAVAALCAESFVEYDHRGLAVIGTTRGAAAWAQNFRTLADLSPDTTYRADHFRSAARGFYCHGGWHGTREGGRYEIPLHAVLELDADGRIVRADIYDDDGIDAFLARFAELAADDRPVLPGSVGPLAGWSVPRPRTVAEEGEGSRESRVADEERGSAPQFLHSPVEIPANAVTRVQDRVCEYGMAGKWSALQALYAQDMVHEDRRRLLRNVGDRQSVVAELKYLWEECGARVTRTVLATAGNRLALDHWVWNTQDERQPTVLDALVLVELNAEDLLVAAILFDANDRAAASAEIMERWGRSSDLIPDALIEYVHAWNDHDVERLRAATPADFVVYDRRRTGIGRIDRDGNVASLAALWELSRDVCIEPLYEVAVAPHGVLLVNHWFGTNAEGGEFESVYVALVRFDGGQMVGLEIFEVDDLAAAKARFEELGASAQPSRS
jgi:ketosteroid isomerase-like protein